MTTESRKLQTRMDGPYLLGFNDAGLYAAYEHDARIAQELMDPARKTPETPLEHEQREVIRKLFQALSNELTLVHERHDFHYDSNRALLDAKPFLED